MLQRSLGALTFFGPATECPSSFKENMCVKEKQKHFETEDLFVNHAGLKVAHINQLRKEFRFVIKKD